MVFFLIIPVLVAELAIFLLLVLYLTLPVLAAALRVAEFIVSCSIAKPLFFLVGVAVLLLLPMFPISMAVPDAMQDKDRKEGAWQ
jgi:hypothetical protein